VLLLAAAALVLLLACANLANLILSRASTREREYAVRAALGASRQRLVRQLMVENGILAVCGTAAGVAVAAVLTQVLMGFLSTERDPLFLNLRMDLRLLAFVASVAGITCIAFGLMPAWSATRLGGTDGASEAIRGRGSSVTRRSFGLRQGLIVSQVALSLVLLFGAFLFAGTLANLLAVDPGFDAEAVSVARVDFSGAEVPQQRKVAFKREILEAIRRIPGVTAAEVRHVPFGGTGTFDDFLAGAVTDAPVGSLVNAISDGYLGAMGMSLLAGRDIAPGDSESAPKVALVNESFVRRFGLAGNPVGETLRRDSGGGQYDTIRIVGIVEDTLYQGLRENSPPIVFVPVAQNSDPRGYTDFMIHSTASLGSVSTSVRSSVARIAPRLAVQVTLFRSTIESTILRERLMATLSGYFGVLAALIAAVGLYGMMSYVVASRTSEIGVRIAMGAGRADILRIIMGQAGTLVCIGLVLGAGFAFVAGQSARFLIFGLNPFDLRLAGLACALLLIVATAASYLPARRAMRVDPVVALRKD
jgi:putative ABC transport system permease protein